MFNHFIHSQFNKSAGLFLSAILLNGITINPVYSNDIVRESKDTTINTTEIILFCSTILNRKQLQKLFPDLTITTETLTGGREIENETDIATNCPKNVFVLSSDEPDRLITNRQQIAEQITKYYLENGYINSRAILYSSEDILIDEGQVTVSVTGADRLQKYVRSRIIPAANPFNTQEIEDRLRLLKNDPLVENIEATLKPNEETNTSELIIDVTAAKSFFGSVGIDNYSPPSVGGEKFNFNLGYRNLTGIGDTFAIAYSPRLEAFDGTYDLGFNYQAPLNSMNGTLNLGVNINRNEVVEGEFADSDIRGESETYSISYRQPFILTPREELAFSLGFTYRDGQTFIFQNGFPFGEGPDDDGISKTSVFELGQDYTLRDSNGAWGFRSLFRLGVGIFDATDNESPVPDSEFFSWLAQIQRVQVLGDNNFLIVQADLQLTPHSLLPSEQFAIGGGQSVRGYRQNALTGDNGFRFSIEDRITIAKNDAEQPVFVIAPFFNIGAVWNKDNNPNQVPEDNLIAALGLGLLWEPVEGLNLRLDYAPPLIELSGDREYDIQDDGLHFSANYSF